MNAAKAVKKLVKLLKSIPELTQKGDVWTYDLVWGNSLQEADDNPSDTLIMVRASRQQDCFGIREPPELIIQILPKKGRRRVHRDRYQNVLEYWCIDLIDGRLCVWHGGKTRIIDFGAVVKSIKIPGLQLSLSNVLKR